MYKVLEIVLQKELIFQALIKNRLILII